MRLHEDKAAFEVIINDVAGRQGVRRDVLEKDYYVTLLLKELSEREHQAYAYFKGGTALYKALKSVRRFSEDIDLTVYIEDCPTASQAKKRLEDASLKFTVLERGALPEKHKGSVTCEYLYTSVYALDTDDVLQRFGRVKIEATSFTVSEPTQDIVIAPHLYELADETQKRILRDMYNVVPFPVKTMSLGRIFTDKVFATQFYFERNAFFDVSKHVYDLSVLLGNETIKTFLQDKNRVDTMIAYKRREEKIRKGGIPDDMRIADFSYFRELDGNSDFETAFERMQRVYVFAEKDRLSVGAALDAVSELRRLFD